MSEADYHRMRSEKLRAAAKVLALLGHDTPERAALLRAGGVELDEGVLRYLASLNRAILAMDDYKTAEVMELAWFHPDRFRLPMPDGDQPPRPVYGLNTRRYSDPMSRTVEWLWWQRIPLGKLTLISGDPGLGKTWLLLDILARITTGRDFPDGSPNTLGPRDVLWASAEDDDEDTIKPRFQMLGGDVSRFHSVAFLRELVPVGKAFKDRESTLDLGQHIDKIEEWLAEHPLVVAVALDPLAAFLGKVDTHRNSEVRAILEPLKKLAARRRVGILGNNHLNKCSGETNALYRGMGSIAFVAAARSSWLVTPDPAVKDRRLFTDVKVTNKKEDVGGMAFRVGPTVPGAFSWEKDRVDLTADQALRAGQGPIGPRAPARAEAREFLRDLLKNGPVDAVVALDRADAAGLCRRTVMTEKKALGIESKRIGGRSGKSVWALPSNASP
jgi:hypothetical protein